MKKNKLFAPPFLTHMEFLTKLKRVNNPIYKALEFVEEYQGTNKPIKAIYKYGLVYIIPESAYKMKKITLRMAVNKTDYIVSQAKEVHKNTYKYTNTKYNEKNNDIIIFCSVHGDVVVNYRSHIAGAGCNKCGTDKIRGKSQKGGHTEFLEELKQKNRALFLELTFIDEYINVDTMLRAHNQYGEVWVNPSRALSGKGVNIKSAVDKTAYIVAQFEEIQGTVYDYSQVEYVSGSQEVIVVCPIHGAYPVKPTIHLGGSQCPDCHKETLGWNRSAYIKRIKNRISSCYILRCYNKVEEFYKVGISVDIYKRFKTKKSMPYEYEIVQEFRGSAGYVWDKEKELHRMHRGRELSYIPKIYFEGETECFSEILWDEINK